MSKIVDTVVDTGGDLFGIGRSIFDKTVGALWDSLTPDVPEEDLATLAKGLQKGIDQPRRITFGRDRVGGVIAHQAEVERDKKKFVQMVVLINGAPIDALEEIYIADKPLSEYSSESWDYELSDGRHTTANSKAVSKMAGWTAAHIGYGQAHIFVEFENNREVFPDGISDTEFLIRGARVWDPRDTNQDPNDETTWLWSQNAVLCALHYVRFYGAHEVPFERLPLEWWIAAINVCDEEAEFTDKDGNVTTEPRYTTNGSFTFTTKPLDVLNQLEACFAGKIFRQMGQWYVRVGAWYGNPTYTINADDVHGNIKIKWHADLRDRANVVRATFTDPEQNYERTDAPPVISAAYQARDNQVLEKSITLPFVRSSTTAQRLATIHLEQTRLGEIELPLKHKGLAAAVGRTVYLNLPGESINNKVYRVTERRFRLDGGVTLMCIEDGPGLWGDNLIPGAQDLTPNSDYLVGKPKPINDVRVTVDGDGNGILKWDHPTPLAVHEYDVEFVKSSSNEPVYKSTVTYTQVTIPKLALGDYTARISARNIFGQRSNLVAIQFDVLTPSQPTVSVVEDFNQITLTAELNDAGIGTQFEWEFLGTNEQPQTSERAFAQIYNRIGLKSETEYNFRVRSVNHLGASAWVYVSATTTTVDLTEYINDIPLTKLDQEAQDFLNEMNQLVDRLRENSDNNIDDQLDDIKDNIEQDLEDIRDDITTVELGFNYNLNTLDAKIAERTDFEKVVFDMTVDYLNWRTTYEQRTEQSERLVDAVAYIDPESGVIVNKAYEATGEALQEAYTKIDAVNALVELSTQQVTQTATRLTKAESTLALQAGQINSRATYTEVQSEIAGAIQALTPAYSWQFNSSDEGFTGVSSHNAEGFIVAINAVTSPTISYIADDNPMFRVRVRLHDGATWRGNVIINDSITLKLPAPGTDSWETLQVNAWGLAGYTGEVTSLKFDLGACDIDSIEVGKRGANDLALQDIVARTTTLETDINARTGIMAQYASTAWVLANGYQKESDVNTIIDTFNTTYSITATLQEFTDNDILTKANNAQLFIDGAEAYIEQQIFSFNAKPGGTDEKFSLVNQRLDAQAGIIDRQIAQIQGLDLDLQDASINDVLEAYNALIKNNELAEVGVQVAYAQEQLKAQVDDSQSLSEQSKQLVAVYEQSFAAIQSVNKVVSNQYQAQVINQREVQAQFKNNQAKLTEYEKFVADEFEAVATRAETIEANLGESNSKIETIEQARATEAEATATRFQGIETSVGQSFSRIETMEQSFSSEAQATASRFNQLQSSIGEVSSTLSTSYYTAAETNSAIASAKQQLQASINGVYSTLSFDYYTAANTNQAISQAINSYSVNVDNAFSAQTQRINSIEADTNGNTSSINALSQRATNLESGQSALSTRVSQVKTTADGAVSSISQLTNRVQTTEQQQASANLTLQSHANDLGQLYARVALEVDVNGQITGLNITPGVLRFHADYFFIEHPSTGSEVIASGGGLTFRKNGVTTAYLTRDGRANLENIYADYIEVDTDSYFGSRFYGSRHAAVLGAAPNWAFYASQGAIGPHTSAHEALLPKDIQAEPGDIICDDELMHIADISNAICTAHLSATKLDKAVRGIYTSRRTLTDVQPAGLKGFEEWEQLAYLYDIIMLNSGGEGVMNVCGEGGDLEINDLICASSIPGKGMKLPDGSPERYTVAQVRHNVKFDSPTQIKQVAVIYLRG